MAVRQSHSSLDRVGFSEKFWESLTFLRWRLFSKPGVRQFDAMFQDFERNRQTYETVTGRGLAEARVLEIGYGARPLRLLAMMSMGLNIQGIDLDMPAFNFSLSRLLRILKTNGPERALKSAVRSLLFDRHERDKLRAALEMRGYKLRIEKDRFLVGDAASWDFGSQTIDLVYSTDVFEHIPGADLEKLVAHLAGALSPDGIAIVIPNIYTGIIGGHLLEWYGYLVDSPKPKRSEPWEHLRKARYTANTYLNKLTRADYRRIFSRHFEILEERVQFPRLGEKWLTPEIRQELAAWSDEELFSNRVEFVLRHRPAAN